MQDAARLGPGPWTATSLLVDSSRPPSSPPPAFVGCTPGVAAGRRSPSCPRQPAGLARRAAAFHLAEER